MPPKRRPRKKSEKRLKQKQKQKQNQNVRINIAGGGSGSGGGTVYIPSAPQIPAGFMNTRDNGRIESLLKTIEKRLTLVPATTMEPVFQNANTNISLADLERRVDKPFFDATDGDSKTDPNIPIERVFNAPIKNNIPLREVAAVPKITDEQVNRFLDSLENRMQNIRPKEDPRNLDNIINPTAIPQGEQAQNTPLIELVAEEQKRRGRPPGSGKNQREARLKAMEEEFARLNNEEPSSSSSSDINEEPSSSSSSDINFA
jgi:hypothetical protein